VLRLVRAPPPVNIDAREAAKLVGRRGQSRAIRRGPGDWTRAGAGLTGTARPVSPRCSRSWRSNPGWKSHPAPPWRARWGRRSSPFWSGSRSPGNCGGSPRRKRLAPAIPENRTTGAGRNWKALAK